MTLWSTCKIIIFNLSRQLLSCPTLIPEAYIIFCEVFAYFLVTINNRMLTQPTTECLTTEYFIKMCLFCCHDQQQNAYTTNKRMPIWNILLLVMSAFCSWSWQQNRHIIIKYSVVGCSIFCCWPNGQLALVPCIFIALNKAFLFTAWVLHRLVIF